jgi:hypothetical protein
LLSGTLGPGAGGVVWAQAVKEMGAKLIIGMSAKFAEAEKSVE